jgi:nucleotide-binding universal stress UspA family protein
MLCLRTILHPTNFSKGSQIAFHRALALARQHEARLIILHVTPPVSVYPEMAITPLRPPGYQAVLREMLEELHSQGPGVRVKYRLEPGEPEVAICRVAGQEDCDLIVMGSDGTTWLRRCLLGSLTEHVKRTAPCAVLVLEAAALSTLPPASQEGTQPLVSRASGCGALGSSKLVR